MPKIDFFSTMIGSAWTLSGMYILIEYTSITHTGWLVPKSFAVIAGFSCITIVFISSMLKGASFNTKYVEVFPEGQLPNLTNQPIITEETQEEEIELRPLTFIKN